VVSVTPERAWVLTSAHVVEGDPSPIVAFLSDFENPRQAQVRHLEGGDPRGLSLLVVANPPSGLQAIEPASDATLTEGLSVIVAGFPVAVGRFSVEPRTLASIVGRDLFLSPETGEGFSGGPVLVNGRTVGMVWGREGGYGRAVPLAIVQTYLRGLGVVWREPSAQPPRTEAQPQTLAQAARTETQPQRPAQPKPGETRRNPKDSLTYVWIPPGKFMMGCSSGDNDCEADEKPAHEVEITRGFWIGQTEVTQATWKKVVGSDPSRFKGDQLPIEMVSWEEAGSYCKAVGLRLPTEAEWEYAARAGTIGPRYGDLEQIAWYRSNSNSTHPVGQRVANAFGLYDMLGNVFEWVGDWYDEKHYERRESKDPKGPSGPLAYRTLRGSSWDNVPQWVRVSVRGQDEPAFRGMLIGFRCAGDLP
jgi:formylglycine-generating enzyme required for sulfatase activity